MGKATYRIGPSDFFTPGDLSADADTVESQVSALDRQIEGNEGDLLHNASAEFIDQWTAFVTSWRAFYRAHFGGFFSNVWTALNDSNRDDLIRYENQLGAFEAQAQVFGASLVAPVDPSTGSKDTLGAQLGAQGLPGLSSIVLVAAAVVVVLLVWKS